MDDAPTATLMADFHRALWREIGRLRPPARYDAGLTDVAPALRGALLETFAALEQHALC